MKIIHFTLGSVNPNSSNGINRVIEEHAKFGNELGNEILVVSLKKKQREKTITIKREGFEVKIFNSIFSVISFLKKNSESIDVLHFHNVWSFQNVIIYIALLNKILYFVTPHAGFMQDRVRNKNYFFKILFHFLFQKRFLDKATGIHAVSREEISLISYYTANKNIFFVPNGINTKLKKIFEKKTVNKKINIGYLGRISDEKNILGLIKSISLLDENILNKIKILIMGPDKNRYANRCKNLVTKLNLGKKIFFEGSIDNEEKWSKLSKMDIYIQPSYSDGPPLTIIEAMICELPIIATRTCNISYLNGEPFLKMVEPIPRDIARGITEALDDFKTFKKSGKNAYYYVVKNLDSKLVAEKLITAYRDTIKNN